MALWTTQTSTMRWQVDRCAKISRRKSNISLEQIADNSFEIYIVPDLKIAEKIREFHVVLHSYIRKYGR